MATPAFKACPTCESRIPATWIECAPCTEKGGRRIAEGRQREQAFRHHAAVHANKGVVLHATPEQETAAMVKLVALLAEAISEKAKDPAKAEQDKILADRARHRKKVRDAVAPMYARLREMDE